MATMRSATGAGNVTRSYSSVPRACGACFAQAASSNAANSGAIFDAFTAMAP